MASKTFEREELDVEGLKSSGEDANGSGEFISFLGAAKQPVLANFDQRLCENLDHKRHGCGDKSAC